MANSEAGPITPNAVIHGDCLDVLPRLPAKSIDLSVWSPPYYVGEYASRHDFGEWRNLITTAIQHHDRLLAPGCFCVINIADILSFEDESLRQVGHENVARRRVDLSAQEIRAVKRDHPEWDRYDLADHFGCSEQTIQRRLEGVHVRGGNSPQPTRVELVGDIIKESTNGTDLHVYDYRVWDKDPAWENSQWHSGTYRSVDGAEHLFILRRAGVTEFDRSRLSDDEWVEWGSRKVWSFPSVASNDEGHHDLKRFPAELPRRFIRMLTTEDSTVLDPFAGSGTTLDVADRLGRDWLGIEKERVAVAACRGSLDTPAASGVSD